MGGDKIQLMSDTLSKSLTTTQCPFAEQEEPPLRIRISVFIDGTDNNIYNIMLRQQGKTKRRKASYLADLSNVARLSKTYLKPKTDETHYHSIYIEGMGTEKGRGDNTRGYAFGKGKTGISHRADLCFEKIVKYIGEVALGHSKIDRLRVDCFGFSRGAAAARHLVHLMVREKDGLIAQVRQHVVEFEIPFVGLFDTVAHYGTHMADDTTQLRLDAIKDKSVMCVVQLAAGDEHRYNFPLTDIASAKERGQQIFLPGAHSDVGGGYNTLDPGEAHEDKLVVFEVNGVGEKDEKRVGERCEAIRKELVALGWYKNEKIEISQADDGDDYGKTYKVRATREGIKNTYSYVALHIMAERARDNGLEFNLASYKYSGDDLLREIKPLIEHNTDDDQCWLYNMDSKFRDLRRCYLHFSSRYNETFEPHKPQFHIPGKVKFDDSYDTRMNGRRQRQIFTG
jgi:hypothetical protein